MASYSGSASNAASRNSPTHTALRYYDTSATKTRNKQVPLTSHDRHRHLLPPNSPPLFFEFSVALPFFFASFSFTLSSSKLMR